MSQSNDVEIMTQIAMLMNIIIIKRFTTNILEFTFLFGSIIEGYVPTNGRHYVAIY